MTFIHPLLFPFVFINLPNEAFWEYVFFISSECLYFFSIQNGHEWAITEEMAFDINQETSSGHLLPKT